MTYNTDRTWCAILGLNRYLSKHSTPALTCRLPPVSCRYGTQYLGAHVDTGNHDQARLLHVCCMDFACNMGCPVSRQRRSFGRIRKCQPSGRYQASYVGPHDKLHKAPETFAAKVDAEGWLTDRRREIDRELWSPPATDAQKVAKKAAEVKFSDYAEKWVTTRIVKGRPLRLLVPARKPHQVLASTQSDVRAQGGTGHHHRHG